MEVSNCSTRNLIVKVANNCVSKCKWKEVRDIQGKNSK